MGLLTLCFQLIFGGEVGIAITIGVSLALLMLRPQIPTWLIMKMYGARTLSQGEVPEILRVTQLLAKRANLKNIPTLYYVPSSAMNAFTTGTVENSAIAITDGLLRNLSLREIAGVIGHEVSHITNHDLQIMNLADTFSRLITIVSQLGLILLIVFLPLWLLGWVDISFLAVAILVLSPLLSAHLQAALSRTREFDADLGAAELTGDPDGLASALDKIDSPYKNLWQRIFLPQRKEINPSLLRTHPPANERVRRLRSLSRGYTRNEVMPVLHEPHYANRSPAHFVIVTKRPKRHFTGLWY